MKVIVHAFDDDTLDERQYMGQIIEVNPDHSGWYNGEHETIFNENNVHPMVEGVEIEEGTEDALKKIIMFTDTIRSCAVASISVTGKVDINEVMSRAMNEFLSGFKGTESA